MERGLCHQGRFVEAGEDQLELARIGDDIADAENARLFAFELGGINRNHILVETKAEFGDGAEFDGQPEERQKRIGIDLQFGFVVAHQGGGMQLAALAMQRLDGCDVEIDFPRRHQLAHLVDAVL